MSDESLFPPPTGWLPTLQTLHIYSAAVGVVPRAHAEFHPKWWHVSLELEPDGLVSDKMSLPSGGQFWLKMDLHQHKTLLITEKGALREFDMTAGLTGSEFGDALLAAVGDLGLSAEYAREKFESDESREYDPKAVESIFTALTNVNRILKDHRATLSGEVSPVQLWPHGFDISFEWFGTRMETYEEDGETQEIPAQLNCGFYPGGDEPYFYSNPWPFEENQLVDQPLPEGATWHTEGWKGTYLPYEELVGDDNAEARLREFARVVFEITSPTLMA